MRSETVVEVSSQKKLFIVINPEKSKAERKSIFMFSITTHVELPASSDTLPV